MKVNIKSVMLGTAALAGMLVTSSAVANADSMTIKAGDTVWAYSQKYHVSIDKIAQANNLSNPNLIIAGHTIDIPGVKTGAKVSTKAVATKSTTTASASSTKTTSAAATSVSTTSAATTQSTSAAATSSSVTSASSTSQAVSSSSVAAQSSSTSTASASSVTSSASTSSVASQASSSAAVSAATSTSSVSQASAASQGATSTSSQAVASTTTQSSSSQVQTRALAYAAVASTSSSNNTATTNSSNSSSTTTSSTTTGSASALIAAAKTYLGTPYEQMDCSAFTQAAFAKIGRSIGRTTYAQETVGTHVSFSSAQAGDLIFWGSDSAPSHVGIYLGGGSYIASPTNGKVVSIKSTAYYTPSFAIHMF